MLRFIRNVLLWGDPETSKGDTAIELLELQKQAQGIMMERQLPRGTALPRLIHSLSMLLVVSAPNNPSRGEVVPTVAEALLFIDLEAGAGVSDLADWPVAISESFKNCLQ